MASHSQFIPEPKTVAVSPKILFNPGFILMQDCTLDRWMSLQVKFLCITCTLPYAMY